MAQLKVPKDYAFRAGLELVAKVNKFECAFAEDASVSAPVLVIPSQPEAFGFSAVASAMARQSKDKAWPKNFLGDGNAALAAQIEQFVSMAEGFFTGVATETKTVVGQIQNAIKVHSYLVNETFTLADLLLYVALHQAVLKFSAKESKDFGDVVRWMIHIQNVSESPLEPIKVPQENPWVNHGRPEKAEKGPAQGGQGNKQARQPKQAKPKAAPQPQQPKGDSFDLCDIRVAQIVEVWPHPNADLLYCEKIDIGGGVIKSVVTGVRKFVPIEQMQNRRVVVFTNIKPGKIKGEVSEAMVLAGSNADHTKVELLEPPADAPVGTRVLCGDLVHTENPPVDKNGKAWKAVAEPGNLTINADHVACYKGVPLRVAQGNITVPTLANCEYH